MSKRQLQRGKVRRMSPSSFCKCGAPSKNVGRKHAHKCLKTEQSVKNCDGIWHGNKNCILWTKKRANKID